MRYVHILFDPIQYKFDIESVSSPEEEIYSKLTLLVRRKAKENTFKAILTTITDLYDEL